MVNLVIPCALTCLDHWSPEVKGQGMISFIHVAKNVKTGALDWYGDVILDACCQNIASADEIWQYVVEMSVLLVTCIQRDDPRSLWFEKILTEIPFWRRIFLLLFQWLHVDDDETVLLVLKRLHTIVRLTWIRKSPYFERLVDELVVLYKEAALRKAREEIRTDILSLLIMLQQCKGLQFETAWNKHHSDPNLTTLDCNLLTSRNHYLQSSNPKLETTKPTEGSELGGDNEAGENRN
ncbi:hypothetical protein V6N13_062718 [Hibiscus sabdariffa]